jgi:hypothetical protein
VTDLTHLTPEQAQAVMKRATKKGHKYHATPTVYQGQRYDSKREAEYAASLDRMKAAGAIEGWARGGCFVLVPGKRGQRIEYRPDFYVHEGQGAGYWVDVKGMETEVFKLKARLLKHVRPDVRLLIVSKDGERWL